MGRRRKLAWMPDTEILNGALEAMKSEELRQLILDMLLELDPQAGGRFIDELVGRAARNRSGWVPPGPSNHCVAEVVSFVEKAKGEGCAEPFRVEEYLRQGTNAFLAKDYKQASQIFAALLPPLADCEIYLGQDEMLDEVLSVDVSSCAAQYVVSIYMATTPEHRAPAVRMAIDKMGGLGLFWRPLHELEQVAVEPLSGFEQFLPKWRAQIDDGAMEDRQGDWGRDQDRWLREVVQRMDGAEGLAQLARSSKRAEDLRSWCEDLVKAGDWQAALKAHEEAAEIVSDKKYHRAGFLDGAALAAQELGCRDLPARLERAWRDTPSLLRLRRWLGVAGSKVALKKRAAKALANCPKSEQRQRALLFVLLDDLESAAKLLAGAPGLGWSREEHPGHLLFPLFHKLMGRTDPDSGFGHTLSSSTWGMSMAELEWMTADPDQPQLVTPELHEVLELVCVDKSRLSKSHAEVLKSMRKAAEKRVAGVTKNKRRRYYGHAAQLVAACAACDPTPRTDKWVAGIQAKYSRYPALRGELKEHLDSN